MRFQAREMQKTIIKQRRWPTGNGSAAGDGENMYREPVQVLVYCYRLIEGAPRWLLLKRVPERGGFWQGITGAIEPGEPLKDAALRELREETGLSPLTIRQSPIQYSITVRPEWAYRYNYDPAVQQLTEYVFVGQLAADAMPVLSDEHSDFCWKSTEDALPMFKWPKNAEALELIAAELAQD